MGEFWAMLQDKESRRTIDVATLTGACRIVPDLVSVRLGSLFV